jgi:dihydroxyacetone kinase-like protein
VTVIGIRELPGVFRRICELVDAQKDRLTELDSLIGDGDLGITMSKAFHAAAEEAAAASDTDIGRALQKVGMAIARAAPSTMGTLIATGFMRGAKCLVGRQEADTVALGKFFEAFVQGIMERGKAKLGEKTILDALNPAAEALLNNRELPVSKALQNARTAAKEGLEATRFMQPAHGKAFYHQEAAKGIEDPGALTGFLIVEGFVEGLSEV